MFGYHTILLFNDIRGIRRIQYHRVLYNLKASFYPFLTIANLNSISLFNMIQSIICNIFICPKPKKYSSRVLKNITYVLNMVRVCNNLWIFAFYAHFVIQRDSILLSISVHGHGSLFCLCSISLTLGK